MHEKSEKKLHTKNKWIQWDSSCCCLKDTLCCLFENMIFLSCRLHKPWLSYWNQTQSMTKHCRRLQHTTCFCSEALKCFFHSFQRSPGMPLWIVGLVSAAYDYKITSFILLRELKSFRAQWRLKNNLLAPHRHCRHSSLLYYPPGQKQNWC